MTYLIRAILLLVFVASPASGADLRLSLGGAVEYDDNVFRTDEDEEDDVLFRIRPGVRIQEDRGDDLNFSVGYAIPFEWAVDFNDQLRDEDHIADGRFTYHVNDRLEFFGDDRFGYLRSGQRSDQIGSEGVEGGQAPTISDERERVTRNDGQLGMLYHFSPRTVARFAASSDYFDPTREDRSRVYSVSGTADVQYRLNLAHQVGGGVGYTYQEFDERDFFAGSNTNTYRIFGSWRWMIDETLTFEASAGPSYLMQEQESSPNVVSQFAVPFSVVTGPVSGGVRDRNGDPIPAGTPIGAGSLLVASYLADPGTGTQVNCSLENGEPVLAGCSQNILLNTTDPVDRQVISAIGNTIVPITNDNPSGDSGGNLTIFGQATLVKRWSPTHATALSYTRRQGSGSGLGSTVVADAGSLSHTWDFLERWEFSLRGDVVYRESVFDSQQTLVRVHPVTGADLGLGFPVGVGFAGVCTPGTSCTAGSSFNSDRRSGIDTLRWSLAGRITHRLFRSTLVYGQVRYDDQASKRGTLGRETDFENVRVTAGVRHYFEPIRLW